MSTHQVITPKHKPIKLITLYPFPLTPQELKNYSALKTHASRGL
jgi:hypothetical protein